MDRVYKMVEVVGTSSTSLEKAIEGAVEKAAMTLHNIDWFEVVETRGRVIEGKVAQYQVTLKLGFRLD